MYASYACKDRLFVLLEGKHLGIACIPVCSRWFSPTHLAAAGTSMHESGANHVLSEEVGVGVPADPVINDGLPQALQPVRIVVWGARRPNIMYILHLLCITWKQCGLSACNVEMS